MTEWSGGVRIKNNVEYQAWRGMRARCLNPKTHNFADYGGRGIKVCRRWLNSFEAFFADVGERPSEDHSLDRFPNVNGDYEPGNVRWATKAQQSRNTRRSRVYEFRGESLCLSDWADRFKMHRATLRRRVLRYGMSIERALTEPLGPKGLTFYRPRRVSV